MERVNVEMRRVMENILDPDTEAKAKRKIMIQIELKPDDDRMKIAVSVTAKSKLAENNAEGTVLCVSADEEGEMTVEEMVRQVPGQISIEGAEEPKQKVMRIPNAR